jgi:hypothetical protein
MRRYTARMEFFAVAEEVEKLLDQGASYVLAFEKLHHEKKITMSYYTFYSYARKRIPIKQQTQPTTPKKTTGANMATAIVSGKAQIAPAITHKKGPIFSGSQTRKIFFGNGQPDRGREGKVILVEQQKQLLSVTTVHAKIDMDKYGQNKIKKGLGC